MWVKSAVAQNFQYYSAEAAFGKMPTKIDRSAICTGVISIHHGSPLWRETCPVFKTYFSFLEKCHFFWFSFTQQLEGLLFGLRQHMTSFLLAVLKATNSMQPGDGTCWSFRVSFCDSHFFSLPMTCPSKKISAVERSVLALCFFGLTSFSHPNQGLPELAKVSKKNARQISNFNVHKFISIVYIPFGFRISSLSRLSC